LLQVAFLVSKIRGKKHIAMVFGCDLKDFSKQWWCREIAAGEQAVRSSACAVNSAVPA
jgi:hypothetical protein